MRISGILMGAPRDRKTGLQSALNGGTQLRPKATLNGGLGRLIERLIYICRGKPSAVVATNHLDVVSTIVAIAPVRPLYECLIVKSCLPPGLIKENSDAR